jgi:hypothetical protein
VLDYMMIPASCPSNLQVFAVLPEEVRETVDLYLDGKIEQWYSLYEESRRPRSRAGI